MIHVLCIDPDEDLHETLKIVFSKEFRIQSAYTGKSALSLIDSTCPEIVLLDADLPDMEGLDVLQRLTVIRNSPPVIMLTSRKDIPFVVKSIKLGAADYIPKPYDIKKLKASIIKALTFTHVREGIQTYSGSKEVNKIIGESPEMKAVKKSILKFGPAESSVLITGESGTGKDIAARTLHKLSRRNLGPFVPINCGALPSAIVESELFGSEKGAFTDAVRKPGSFELADRGTLFLDEISEMETAAQVKLLRAIENQEITRLGGIHTLPVDVRIISATNGNILAAIEEKRFRRDLYYRINTLSIHIPPLRQRKSDIPLLVRHFLQTGGHTEIEFTPNALEKLMEYPWPGNVRELKHMVERSILLSETERIEPENIIF